MRYEPRESVRATLFSPVLTFSASMAALGTTAPLASSTVPVMFPSVTCAIARADPSTQASNKNLFMRKPLGEAA